MHSKSDNIEIMMGSETDEIIEELFESILQRYQEGLEESIKGSEFAFDSVDLLYYKLYKISLNRRGAYIDSPKWLKNKKATINRRNNDGKCFQYVITVALNHQNIKNNPERTTKIMPFIEQYNWKEINFPSHKKGWNDFEKNNKTTAHNILYVPYNTEEIRHAYKSKHNLTGKNQVILLMITDDKKWHYRAVKGFSALRTGIKSNHKGNFYCLNCLYSFRTEKK